MVHVGAAAAFWRREDGRKAAMQQFKASLGKLTESAAEGGGRLIVVVDELDRCRPDYALAVLEVIKHFFEVQKVHFVLGVNLDALQQIVRVRYGMGVDSADYLKRFISLSMRLPELVAGQGDVRSQIKYFESSAQAMGIEQNMIEDVTSQLKLAAVPARISLRDIEKILTRLVMLPGRKAFADRVYGWKILTVSLALLKTVRPDLYEQALRGALSIQNIDEFYGIETKMLDREAERGSAYNHSAFIIRGLWHFVISGGTAPTSENDDFRRAFGHFQAEGVRRVVVDIDRIYFGLFEMSE